jgi:uncharacterized membrane protein
MEGMVIPLGMAFAGMFLIALQHSLSLREIAFVAGGCISLTLIIMYLLLYIGYLQSLIH